MKQKKSLIIVAAVLVAAVGVGIVIARVTDNNGMASINTSNAVATNTVKIANYMYSPMVIKVKVGTTVKWINEDSVHHSVTAVTASAYAPDSPLLAQGQSYSFTFKKAGTYPIYCQIHPYMHATVIVTS